MPAPIRAACSVTGWGADAARALHLRPFLASQERTDAAWQWVRVSLNSRLLAAQWSALHGLDPTAIETAEFLGMRRDRWDADGETVVELWRLPELGHEWPQGAAESILNFWNIAED